MSTNRQTDKQGTDLVLEVTPQRGSPKKGDNISSGGLVIDLFVFLKSKVLSGVV